MRTYELMVIHRSDLAEDDVRKMIGDLEVSLGNGGATVASTDFWGKRRFAYEINHMTEGFYSVMTFEAEGLVVDALDRTLSLSDSVVRHKIIRPDTR